MFNDTFYPTPSDLITRMWGKIRNKNIDTILEPSAGKGDIVDYIKGSYGQYKSPHIDCVEIEPELASILFGKGYNVLGDDFLTFKTFNRYDAIIMNPPFDNGDKHLLKAIELMERGGGHIVCLLNAETLKNDYSNARKVLAQKLEQYGAEIEYIADGFKRAERKTDVEVALIYIHIDKPLSENEVFKNIEFEVAKEFKEQISEESRTALMTASSAIFNLVQDYEKEARLVTHMVETMAVYKQFLLSKGCKAPKLRLTISPERDYLYQCSDINEILAYTRKTYWERALQQEVFRKYLTGKASYDIQEKLEKQSNIEFNYNNVAKMLESLTNIFINNIGDCAVQVFDEIKSLSHYSFSDNIYLYNGWKSNNGVKINKKIIVNGSDSWSAYSGRTTVPDIIIDLEKVLNYFDGFCDYTAFPTYDSRYMALGGFMETDYFDIKSYKKGTFHITVKRLDLLDKLNIFVGQKKNWLPHADEVKTERDRKAVQKIFDDICESELNHMDILLSEAISVSSLMFRGRRCQSGKGQSRPLIPTTSSLYRNCMEPRLTKC